MSDSDDDYMSEKLLQNCVEDIRPGLVHNRSTKRQHDLEKKRMELSTKRPKNKHELEQEAREKGLNTAISSDNKGFKLLQKMGFKPGEGLGKTNTGRIEPIKVEVKAGKSGLGVESRIKERIMVKKTYKEETIAKKLNEFQNNHRLKQAQKYLNRDFHVAQKTCEDLDSRNDVSEPVREFYWTRNTIRKKREIEEEDEEEFKEEFDGYINEENLTEIIDYLRGRHLYCMFCAFIATDEEDLRTSCPGPYRADHDDC